MGGRVWTRILEEAATTNFYLSPKVAYLYFYGALFVVMLIAIALPWVFKTVKSYRKPGEEFATARNTQPWWSITCSYFSSSLGTWVLTAPASIAQDYSLWGVAGYALATGLPWLFAAFVGPRMRRLTAGKGFSSVDFVKRRLGSFNHLLYALTAFASVFLAYIVECISLSDVIRSLAPETKGPLLTCSIVIAVYIYTCISGLQATLLTDRFQLVGIITLVIVACIGVFSKSMHRIVATVGQKAYTEAAHEHMNWSKSNFVVLPVLVIACFYPTFMDPATWSRMYAARSETDARFGLVAAACTLFIPMVLLGMMGIVAGVVNDLKLTDDTSVVAPLTLLHSAAWSGAVVVLATLLCMSTVDTLCNSMTSFVIANFAAFARPINVNLARLLTLACTIVGLCLILKNPPAVMSLFMCCNLIATCTTGGLLLSLWPLVTPTGVTCGVFAAALSVMSIGWIRLKSFAGGFSWWLLPEGSAEVSALVTFIICGVTSLTVTLGVSHIEFCLREDSREEQREVLLSLRENEGPDASTTGSASIAAAEP